MRLNTNTVEQSNFVMVCSFTRLPPNPESVKIPAIAINTASTPTVPKSCGVRYLAKIIFVIKYNPSGKNFSTPPQIYITLFFKVLHYI